MTIVNLLKEKLGEQFKLSATTIELVLKLSHEFVYKLADEANNQCVGQDKKTLNHTHVLSALKVSSLRLTLQELGIGSYIDGLGSMYECEIEVNAVAMSTSS